MQQSQGKQNEQTGGKDLDAAWMQKQLQDVRDKVPLVLNLTNLVAVNFTANALLALGASPLMSSSKQELQELLAISQALLLNIGTPHQEQLQAMQLAGQEAARLGLPVVLDPVGAGASRMRTDAALGFLRSGWVGILRANPSEVLQLAGQARESKGVDSLHSGQQALQAGRELGHKFGCVVCISGARDYVLAPGKEYILGNGDPLMGKVTAMGCAASSLAAAFAGVQGDLALAAAAGMAATGVSGELAAAGARGPGSLQQNFLDQLFHLGPQGLQALDIQTQEI
ncbi:MAG: hydroxyethylthiazole kinase [Desulfohalobiaceae bacterium]